MVVLAWQILESHLIKSHTIGTLYKGAGPGTHWHIRDPRSVGFTPQGAFLSSANAMLNHISAFSNQSPYLSFSTSFAIAREYALNGPGGFATAVQPGYVYEVDLSTLSSRITLFDPVNYISSNSNGLLPHEHNGGYELIAEVAQVAPVVINYTRPRAVGGGVCHPNISISLKALVNAIRDAEILVHGNVPHGAVVRRHDVF